MRLHGLLPVLAALALGTGCKPKIGDDCTNSTDCSVSGDRLCDTTQPGGYCTIFNCEPGRCPEEAICVAFDLNEDPSPGCERGNEWARLSRSFCLRSCEGQDDCRTGYTCADPGTLAASYRAAIIDSSPNGSRVCVRIASTPPPTISEDPAVCSPAGPDFDVPYESGAGTGAAGSAGAAGASGASGAGGTGGQGEAGETGSVEP